MLDVVAHRDGTHFLSSSSDVSVKLWDIPQRTCVTTTREHADQVWALWMSVDRKGNNVTELCPTKDKAW